MDKRESTIQPGYTYKMRDFLLPQYDEKSRPQRGGIRTAGIGLAHPTRTRMIIGFFRGKCGGLDRIRLQWLHL